MLTFLRPLARTMPGLPLSIRHASTLPRLPIFEAIARHDPHSTAVVHAGRFTYGQLLPDVARARDALVAERPLTGERIAFLVESSYDYVGTCPPLLDAMLTW